MVSRAIAYHGTPQGALAITGIPAFKAPFEPLTPAASALRTPTSTGHLPNMRTTKRLSVATAPTGSPRPSSSRAPRPWPRCSSSWCRTRAVASPPPPGYFERVREICDQYDVLLVSDEVICAYGRIGSMFACDDLGRVPDIITSAKGLTSGYSPLGAMVASDRLFEPFNDGKTVFGHGYTFGGHPVSAAVAMANLDIFEREGINDHVKQAAPAFRPPWRSSTTCRSSETSAARASTASNSSRTKPPRRRSTTRSPERLLRGFLTPALWEAGLYCRADDRGDPVIQLAPPLISGQAEFDAIYEILHGVLTEAGKLL